MYASLGAREQVPWVCRYRHLMWRGTRRYHPRCLAFGLRDTSRNVGWIAPHRSTERGHGGIYTLPTHRHSAYERKTLAVKVSATPGQIMGTVCARTHGQDLVQVDPVILETISAAR